MSSKAPVFRTESKRCETGFKPPVQCLQFLQVATDPQPDDPYPSEVREGTNTIQVESQWRTAGGFTHYLRDGINVVSANIAQEFQRDMYPRWIDPLDMAIIRPGQVGKKGTNLTLDAWWQLERNEGSYVFSGRHHPRSRSFAALPPVIIAWT
jgi:hypothetical protein